MISEKEVEHIAGLARLQLSEKEQRKFQKELSLVLNYVEQLKKLEVKNVEPTISSSGMANIMRADENQEPDFKQVEQMLKQAPDRKEDFIKVKAIFKKDGA